MSSKRPMKGRDLLTWRDYTREEILKLLDTAIELKDKLQKGETHELLKGKNLAMLFEWESTRTRTSFEVGMEQLGGHAIYYPPNASWGKGKEPLKHKASVLSRYVDGIMYRAFNFSDQLEMAKWADVPVINANSEAGHPCQALSDFMVPYERKRSLKRVRYVMMWAFCPYSKPLGVVNSTLEAGTKLGMDLVLAYPEGYDPNPEMMEYAREQAKKHGSTLTVIHDMEEAAKNADVIHVKGWAPDIYATKGMEGKGTEAPHIKEPKEYKHWIVDDHIVSLAKKDVMVEHALPAAVGDEVTDKVLDGPNSVIYEEAENRLHTQKAILSYLL